MPKTTILLTDPDLKVVETPDRISFCTGFLADDWHEGEDWLESDDAIGRKCAARGDATLIQLVRTDGMAVELRAWRAVLACHEVFFRVLDNGDVLVADHLRNAIAALPMAERHISDEGLVDHLLFRAAPGRYPYCAGVERLRTGDRMTIDLRTGRVQQSQFDKLHNVVQTASDTSYLDAVDRAFEETIGATRNMEGVVNLFSGGIDSTLVHSYLGPEIPALTGITWNVRDYEKDYAENAARLLNIPLQTFEVAKHEYMPLLESSIELVGQPPMLDQIVIVEKAFRQPGQRFLNGFVADVVFGLAGLGGSTARFARHLAAMPGGGPIARAIRRVPGKVPAQISRIARIADQLTQPVNAPNGFAAAMAGFTNMDMMNRAFGADFVMSRFQKRIDYTADLIECSAPAGDRTGRHLEMAHWAILPSDDGIRQTRFLAQALGKSFLVPFMSRSVMESILRVPVHKRYVRGTEPKYILKELLKRRVPDYPVYQKKGANLFGVEQFFIDGPLKDLWERYELPDFLTTEDKEIFLAHPSLLNWNTATLAIWRDRVLRNPDLSFTPHLDRYDA